MKPIENKAYKTFLAEIKTKITRAQYEAMKLVNTTLLNLYWEIGKDIVEKQKEHGWGKAIVETLSKDLQNEFPGVQGYSTDNLWRMRKFYLHYQDNTKLAPLVQEISWSHNIIVMEKCKDDLEREFYIKMTKQYGWTKNVLIHQIEGKSYEQFLLNQTNFEKTISNEYKHQAILAVKDEYNFDFVGLSEAHNERELEIGLINNIRKFLSEMGGDFTFIGNQYRLMVGDEEFYIDLLLYHRKLKSLVAIELKTGKFKPEYTGKMNFYLSVFDDTMKLADEHPSIGIIVCKDKNKTVIEYALKNSTNPIGVASYTLTETLPKEYSGLLPTPEEIEEKLTNLLK
jgi:predicted nuclease of restriction endonuclease-like (RecB) superfamily